MHWLIKKIPFLTPRIHSVLVSRLGHRVEELQQYRRQVRNLLDFRMDHAGQWWNADRSSDVIRFFRSFQDFRRFQSTSTRVFSCFPLQLGKKISFTILHVLDQVQRNQRLASEGIEGNKADRWRDSWLLCCEIVVPFDGTVCQQIDDPFFVFFFSSFDLMKSFDLIDMICARSSLIDCLRRFVANWGEPAKLAFSSEDCHIIHGIIMDYLDKNRWKSINNNNDPHGISFLSPIFWDFWASPSTESTSPSLLQVSAVSVAA